ncbi:hypothetical protein [Rhizobium sp. SG741]|uniref:hypothetical protein n=1 Tax=Rhizobium sp. SG741 TaxID=2587114 RepID=UPI001447020E|nr:hypothetical protein [Rhizobium sp. SG741]NKJ03498.1 hypothetical protein [Rhizobium sp. SG741]
MSAFSKRAHLAKMSLAKIPLIPAVNTFGLPNVERLAYIRRMLERYVIHEDEDGTFAILDAKSYEVVERSGMILQNMPWYWVESLIGLLEELDCRRQFPN